MAIDERRELEDSIPDPRSGGAAAPDAPFDELAYVQSAIREPKSLRSLPRLALSAVALARHASPRLFYLNASLLLANAAVMALQVFLAKLAIQGIVTQSGGGNLGVALPPLVGLVAITAVSGLATSAQQQFQRLLGEKVQLRTWEQILDVTTAVRLETFEGPEFFDDLQRVKANALLRPLTLSQGLVQLVGGVLGMLGLSVALVVIQPVLLPVLLAGGLPLWFLSRRTGGIEFTFRVNQTPQLRLREYLTDLLCGRNEAKEIRAFGLGPLLRRRWEENYREYLDDYKEHTRRRIRLAGLGALVNTLATSVALGVVVWLVVRNRLTLSSAGAGIIAVRLLSGQIQQLFYGVGELFESALFLRDFESFRGRTPVAPASAKVRPPPRVEPFTELRLEGVSFRYPNSEQLAVREVSLTIRAGEVIALVGENGSGKTTLAKLLCQVFEPTAGLMLWDGVDSRELDPEALRRNVGVIFQDFVRYQLSARENVGFGQADAVHDVAAIVKAARRAGADEFISALPDGYDTTLGKEYRGGHDLSLGQWQRIALARAFFRDAGFLVLDEPTASLDARSEYQLFEHVRALAAGRSQLLISHRFSTVKSADRIYVLHHGELVEQGSHEELMRLGMRYAELFDLQARAYR